MFPLSSIYSIGAYVASVPTMYFLSPPFPPVVSVPQPTRAKLILDKMMPNENKRLTRFNKIPPINLVFKQFKLLLII